jgi:hypothetical protein
VELTRQAATADLATISSIHRTPSHSETSTRNPGLRAAVSMMIAAQVYVAAGVGRPGPPVMNGCPTSRAQDQPVTRQKPAAAGEQQDRERESGGADHAGIRTVKTAPPPGTLATSMCPAVQFRVGLGDGETKTAALQPYTASPHWWR